MAIHKATSQHYDTGLHWCANSCTTHKSTTSENQCFIVLPRRLAKTETI